ncbi:MAG: hypothetical protein QOF58_2944, partial [Pseudonocardiales bacterium]|nr:hypothetical protein [Pseudonocardiales bacterium]
MPGYPAFGFRGAGLASSVLGDHSGLPKAGGQRGYAQVVRNESNEAARLLAELVERIDLAETAVDVTAAREFLRDHPPVPVVAGEVPLWLNGLAACSPQDASTGWIARRLADQVSTVLWQSGVEYTLHVSHENRELRRITFVPVPDLAIGGPARRLTDRNVEELAVWCGMDGPVDPAAAELEV